MMAISGSHLGCAELLLQRGANINYAGEGASALDMAIVHVQFEDVLLLLNYGYTHDLMMARRMIVGKTPRPGRSS
jgi:ankyrin repeat protein